MLWCSGFKICPQNLGCSSKRKRELNPPWAGLSDSLLTNRKHMAKAIVWLLRLGRQRDYGFLLALSLTVCSGGSRLPCHEGTQAVPQRDPGVRNSSLLTATWADHLGSRSPSSKRASEDCKPGWPLDCTFRRDSEPESASSARPKLLTHRNWDHECLGFFKPLRFRVISYKAVENR